MENLFKRYILNKVCDVQLGAHRRRDQSELFKKMRGMKFKGGGSGRSEGFAEFHDILASYVEYQ